jgi:hypothetical protein
MFKRYFTNIRKTKLLIIFFIAVQNCAFSQIFSGQYEYYDQIFNFFEDTSVMFSINSLEGLTCLLKGKGKYSIENNLLFINTKYDQSILHSDFKILENNPDSNLTLISVKDIKGDPIPFVYIFLSDKFYQRDKMNPIIQTNLEGNASVVSRSNYVNMEFVVLGYDDLRIPFSKIKGKNIEIIMPNWRVVEGKTLVFFIKSQTTERLNLVGPLNEKYVKLIQRNKMYRFNKMRSKDYLSPNTFFLIKTHCD